jgi:HK97 family phage major capsid protein
VNILKEENRGDDQAKARKNFRILEAVRQLSNDRSLTGMVAEMHQEGQSEMKDMNLRGKGGNLTLPNWLVRGGNSTAEKRDMLAETTTAGGYTVDATLGGLIPILEPKLQVEGMGATVLRGLTSNIDFPRNDADAAAVWASEVATSTETSPTFDRIQMAPERLTAFTDISKQVMLQSSIDMENFVRQRLNFAVRKALDSAALNGSGSSNQPFGILNYSGVNDITIGTDGGVLTWALVVQFETETATDNADMGRLGYLFTPGVAGLLKTTKRDTAGNGFIWEGPNGSGNVNGYRALTTTQMPSTLTKGSSSGVCHAAIFGNWQELIIGQWGGVDLLVNPYTKGKEATVEVIVNSWWDIEVRHAASFCICNEITLS